MAAITIRITGGDYQVFPGGEFNASVISSDDAGLPVGTDPFATFCIELNENISFGRTCYAVLNTEAVNGGIGGGSPDPLDARTAWLYEQFYNQTLAGYDFTGNPGRSEDAQDLQNAIWALEGEKSAPTGNVFYDAAVNSGATSIGHVRILNLYFDQALTQHAQDVLCCTTAVPVPGALLLTGLGSACISWMRRRRMV